MSDNTEQQIEATKAKLKALDKKVQRSIIKKGLRVGAKIIQQAAKAAAPVESGLVKRSIKVRSGKAGKGVTKINVGMGAKDYTGKAFYASFLIYGHKQGNRKLGDKRKSIPANNFLGKAFEENKEAAQQAVIDSWLDQIESACGDAT
jgi:HK97 gp10 family phage protein